MALAHVCGLLVGAQFGLVITFGKLLPLVSLLCLISENVLLGMFLAFINGGLLGWR